MNRVIVTVRNERFQPTFDIEVPSEVASYVLGRLIGDALNWNVDDSGRLISHSIFAEPQGCVLETDTSLADAGVWDGSTLILEGFTAAYLSSQSGTVHPLRRSQNFISRFEAIEESDVPDSVINLSEETNGQTVSRVHAVLICRKGQWQVYHRSTTNQTYLNNQSLGHDDMLALQDGDILEFGGTVLTFRLGRSSSRA